MWPFNNKIDKQLSKPSNLLWDNPKQAGMLARRQGIPRHRNPFTGWDTANVLNYVHTARREMDWEDGWDEEDKYLSGPPLQPAVKAELTTNHTHASATSYSKH